MTVAFLFALISNVYAEIRVVSLSPALTEIMFDLKLGDIIVGTSEYSDYPAAAKKIPRVGSYQQPDIEKIARLNPTHVVTNNDGSKKQLARPEVIGAPVVLIPLKTINDLYEALKKLGEQFRAVEESEKLIARSKSALNSMNPPKKESNLSLLLIPILWLAWGQILLFQNSLAFVDSIIN